MTEIIFQSPLTKQTVNHVAMLDLMPVHTRLKKRAANVRRGSCQAHKSRAYNLKIFPFSILGCPCPRLQRINIKTCRSIHVDAFPLKRKLNRLAQTSVNQTTHYARYIWSGQRVHVKTIQLAAFPSLTYSFVMFSLFRSSSSFFKAHNVSN